jgi:hypothetical protein
VGTGSTFLGGKWLGGEFDDSPPSSAEVKKEWSYVVTPLMYLHGVDVEILPFLCILVEGGEDRMMWPPSRH